MVDKEATMKGKTVNIEADVRRPGPAAKCAALGPVGPLPVAAAIFVLAATLATAALGDDATGATAEPAALAEPTAADVAPLRPFRFHVGYGMGYFRPADVNAYIASLEKADHPGLQTTTEMRLLMSGELSVAYYPWRFLGVRPNFAYYFSPQVITVGYGTAKGLWLHSVSSGLALDLAYDQGKLARFFASPGVSVDVGWFEGYSASGLGLSLALGADFSYGQARARGFYVAVLLRRAKLGVDPQPIAAAPSTAVMIHNLDFTSIIFCLGFQMGI
jgi:hypothetical protein